MRCNLILRELQWRTPVLESAILKSFPLCDWSTLHLHKYDRLHSKRSRIHGFVNTNSIDHIVKKYTSERTKLRITEISKEHGMGSSKFKLKKNKRKSPHQLLKTVENNMRPNWSFLCSIIQKHD